MDYDDILCRFRAFDKGGYNAGRMKFEFQNGEVLKLYEHLK